MERNKHTPSSNFDPKLMWRLFRRVIPFRFHMIVLLCLSLVSSLLNVVPPLFLQYVIDKLILPKDLSGIFLILSVVIGWGCLIAVQNYMQRRLSLYIGLNIVKNLRNQLFEHISHMPFEFFDQTSTGDVVARVTHDADHLTRFLNQGVINFIVNIFMLFGVLIVLFVWDYRFGLILLGLFPLIYGGIQFFTQKVLPINRRSRKMNGVLFGSIEECFNGIREVKLYGREEYMKATLRKWNGEYFNAVIQANKYNAIWGPFIPMLLNIFSTCALIVGCMLIMNANLSLGQLLAAIMYFGLISQPIHVLTRFANEYNGAKAATERVYEILDKVPTIHDAKDAIPLQNVQGAIEFHEVGFNYMEQDRILHDISLKIHPGQLIAIVGPSGVGKTTLVHLVPRFYDTSTGSVTIDGVDIKRYQLNSLRRNIGIVMQNVFLFDGTIAQNIAYGKPEATLEEIKQVASIVQLSDFIESLPLKYNSPIGERGIRLSGGQAQRISIARVLLINPKILILDEPTANVDAITDKLLMSAIEAIMKGRTTLVIAHRLWTIQNADKIVLLRDGTIEAFGVHKELMQSSSFYREFFASQFQNEILEDQLK